MKRLTHTYILGYRIKITYKNFDDGCWGECCSDSKEITLALKCLDDDEQHKLTLIHEVTHMIFRLTGIAYMDRNEEEAYVRCVENLVIPWILKHQKLWNQ